MQIGLLELEKIKMKEKIEIRFGTNLCCPCKDCDQRYVGCHSTCEEYKTYKTRNNFIRKKRLNKLLEEKDVRESLADATKIRLGI